MSENGKKIIDDDDIDPADGQRRTFVIWLSCGHWWCVGATVEEAEDLVDTKGACKQHGIVKVIKVQSAEEYRQDLRRAVALEPDDKKVWKAVEDLFDLGIQTNNIDMGQKKEEALN